MIKCHTNIYTLKIRSHVQFYFYENILVGKIMILIFAICRRKKKILTAINGVTILVSSHETNDNLCLLRGVCQSTKVNFCAHPHFHSHVIIII